MLNQKEIQHAFPKLGAQENAPSQPISWPFPDPLSWHHSELAWL
jgi:hypothetical protein